MNKVVIVFFTVAFISACSTAKFPGVHRITVQQGNLITQAMMDKLKPGMTKSQVRYVLGETMLKHSLRQNRWDYVYTVQIPRQDDIHKQLHVYFVKGRLSHFDGSYAVEEVASEKATAEKPTTEHKAQTIPKPVSDNS